MCRCAVEVEVVFLYVLTVVGLAVGQPEHALFENRIGAIPQCQGKAEDLFVIANAGDAVFAPLIGAGASLVMREVVPGVTILTVVLTDRTALPLGQVRSPFSPRLLAGASIPAGALMASSVPASSKSGWIPDFATFCASLLLAIRHGHFRGSSHERVRSRAQMGTNSVLPSVDRYTTSDLGELPLSKEQ